ncbi:SulP family inorganic anion transporter [Desulfovibrio litoralis]|uniref:Sulfate permease, SulP family n=1 Tax=Desulfovibrio litoralis DSM 11393 TaxID=1121455 RepID=A0A1M7S0Y6_9BACT|nr:SulP family inorganic anion transporter [Desulfovibrio litoralis]SHN52163.1 sulfate permease, SulP family [Desulfovibrio litoralis DSM 11393]
MNFQIKNVFRPRIFDSLSDYNLSVFQKDVMAGITVGVVALPLAMAFAIASGVKPEAGIITAIVAGFLTSLLGGTKVAIGGPTGAFVVIILGIVQLYGVDNLLICTMMAGVILFLLGVFRMGWFANYFPQPLISGFTSGIAITILSTQLKDIFGLPPGQAQAGFIASINNIFHNVNFINYTALILTIGCCLAIVFWPKRLSKFAPGPIAVLILGTALAYFLNLPVETIGSRFAGGIPSVLPAFKVPAFDFDTFQFLLGPAVTIALLGGIESVLCAVVADGMIDDKHDSNQELMAQGIANMVSPLFGGIPSTGAIVRTATNIRNGGRTPIAGIVHALTLLVIMLVIAPLASYVPLAVLSAILVVVAINMGQWRDFKQLHIYPKSDAVVLLITFLLTVFFDLTVAVEVGILTACALFIKRMASQASIQVKYIDMIEPNTSVSDVSRAGTELFYSDVVEFKMSGEFFFGATQKLQTLFAHLQTAPKVMIINMKYVRSLDASSLLVFQQLIVKAYAKNIKIIISGLERQPKKAMIKSGLAKEIGEEYFVANFTEAFKLAKSFLN